MHPRLTRLTLALAPLLLLLTACGGTSAPGVTRTIGDPDAATRLTFVAYPGGEVGDALTWTLTCEPTGGDHPDAEAACAVLASVEKPFGAVPAQPGCEEIPGGPEVVRVTGVHAGERVKARFSRENLCEMDRWDRVGGMFPIDPA